MILILTLSIEIYNVIYEYSKKILMNNFILMQKKENEFSFLNIDKKLIEKKLN